MITTNFKTQDIPTATVEVKTKTVDKLILSGVWNVKCYDRYGQLKWEENNKNIIVTQGLNHMLNVEFAGTSQVNPWWIGLKSTGVPVSGDSLASHPSWTEIDSYTGNRKEYKEEESSTQSMANSAAAVFNINGTATVYGAFLTSVETGTSGILFSVGDFDNNRQVYNGDILNTTYTVNASDV